VDLTVIDFENFDFALPKKGDRFLPMDNPQRFIRRIEQKSHFHATTSFPTKHPAGE
jgi:hypothetical protein